jgi:hypothetical protein
LRRAIEVLAVLTFTGIGVARIVSTYYVFSQTVDEPNHVASGMEWLDRGVYTVNPEQPPLGNVAVAFLPFLNGTRYPAAGGDWVQVGNQILGYRDQYLRNLALARLGVLPFFALATAIVWVWSRRVFGSMTALVSILLFTTLPPILAHGGIATTDMALTGTFMVSMLTFIYFRPTYQHSCLVGLTVALAVISKFSALAFVPPCGLGILACWWMMRQRKESEVSWGRIAGLAALASAIVFIIIWGAYRFSRQGWIPAPEFFTGINFLRLHNARGHTSYLLGEIRQRGWWYFFPVALFVKTPVPFLILSGIGCAVLCNPKGKNWRAFATATIAATLLLVCMTSNINIGIRHILPIYPPLAIVAGYGAVRLWSLSGVFRVGVIALLLWQVVGGARIHPDYLAYFNEFASTHADRVLVVSDLDWGQDLLRLADHLRGQKVTSIALAVHGTGDPGRVHMPAFRNLPPCQPATGWIAASEMALKIGRDAPPYGGWEWLEDYEPRAMVGKSIRLYYIPDVTHVRIPDVCNGKAEKAKR